LEDAMTKEKLKSLVAQYLEFGLNINRLDECGQRATSFSALAQTDNLAIVG
jgi:hypothetical protein